MSEAEGELWSAQFQPGWPDILPHGLIVARSSVSQLDPEPDAEIPDEDDVKWLLHLGVRKTAPRLALIGDLTVRNPLAFGGVSIVMPFHLRDEQRELTPEYKDGILRQYGPWASSILYDHAATVLRTALAGNGLPLFVPFETPVEQLHTSDYHHDSATDESGDDTERSPGEDSQ